MKILSFKGRRLIIDQDIRDVAEKTGIPEAIIAKIENIEDSVKKLDDFYEREFSVIYPQKENR